MGSMREARRARDDKTRIFQAGIHLDKKHRRPFDLAHGEQEWLCYKEEGRPMGTPLEKSIRKRRLVRCDQLAG